MHEYATRFADLLEAVATRIRELTVDRARLAVTLTGLGIVVATLALTASAFLIWAIFGALEIPLTTAGAFAVFGVVLLSVGAYVWFKRHEEE